MHQVRRIGKKRLLRNNPAVTSDTNTPTGNISTKVIGKRSNGFAYIVLNTSISATNLASASALIPLAYCCAISIFE